MTKTKDEYREKQDFIKAIKEVLILDDRSDLMDITYQIDEKALQEIITIYFLGRSTIRIDATGLAKGTVYLEIGRAVYGGGAICEIQE